MYFADALTLDAPVRTSDGYLAVRAKAARTGHYEYSGRDVDPQNVHGLRDSATVNIARAADDVFDKKSVHSFIGKPVTNDHPSQPVNSANWRDHARGVVLGAKWEEGGYLSFDLMLADQAVVDAVQGGKRELSNGYSCDLEFGDFTAADGVKCQARQKSIRGNHVALVDKGRAGPECSIRDAVAICDSLPLNLFDHQRTEKPVKTMLIDGFTVDVSNADTAIATINTILAARDAATGKVTTLEAKAAEDAAAIVAKDAEIVKLTADVAAAKLTPQQMRDAGKAYALVADKAKAAGVTVTDEMDEAAIMKAVVDKAMPGNTYDGDHIRIAFDTLTKDHKPSEGHGGVVPLGSPIAIGDAAQNFADAQAKAAEYRRNAWKNPAAAAA